MLKAAIVTHSLGTSFNTGDGILSVLRDADKDLQILLIGACIIDGSTAGNDLTVISKQGGAHCVCGVKDLLRASDLAALPQ